VVSARRQPRSRGFTLIELMIAMALTAVGLLGLVAMQSIAIRGNMMSRNFGEAVGLAQQRLEAVQYSLYANLSANLQEGGCALNVLPAAPSCSGAPTANLNAFSPDPSSSIEQIYTRCTAVSVDAINNVTTVQATICWNDSAGRSHTVGLRTEVSP
jgi:prepilin-type N-terminal cleavage/methylation domain-containing protein